jgi:hypothetical protein
MTRTPDLGILAGLLQSFPFLEQPPSRKDKGWLSAFLSGSFCDSQLSSTEKLAVSHTITDHSMTFCNSRMFPGQAYDSSNRRVFLSTVVILLPAFRA